MQAGLIYGCGIYTAQQQGIIRKNVYFSAFWNYHYFDHISFLKRSAVVGLGGGLVLGTLIFGKPDWAVQRAVNRAKYFTLHEYQDNFGTNQSYWVFGQ